MSFIFFVCINLELLKLQKEIYQNFSTPLIKQNGKFSHAKRPALWFHCWEFTCIFLKIYNSIILIFLQAVSEILKVGASLLLPPLRERMELLHSLLPQGQGRWDSLSRGKVGVNRIRVIFYYQCIYSEVVLVKEFFLSKCTMYVYLCKHFRT